MKANHVACAALLCASLLLTGCGRHFNLGNGCDWKETAPNEMIITSKSGEIIAGPGMIFIWASYPWIYGNDGKSYFMINSKDGAIAHFQSGEALDAKLKELSLQQMHPPGCNSDMHEVNLYDVITDKGDYSRRTRFLDGVKKK